MYDDCQSEVRTEEAAAAAHVPGLDVRRVPERAAE